MIDGSYDFLENKQILITGGAGFIGSNLCSFLVKKKANVICLDNFSTGKLENIKKLKKYSNFNLYEGDIKDFDTCLKASKDVDFILHQAALGSVPRSIEDPISTNNNNVNGFLNVFYAAHKNNVKRIVYASSSSVYGDSEILPKKEEFIGKPLSPYAISKVVNELYAKNFKSVYGLDSIGLRYFNVFGKNQDTESTYAAVIPKFINAYINNKSPVINGDGNFSRDFTHVDNVIYANIQSMSVNRNEFLNQTYNIACGGKYTISELAEKIKTRLIKFDKKINEIKTINGPVRKGDIPHSFASIKKAEHNLNYRVITDFETGINKTVDWYFNNFKQ